MAIRTTSAPDLARHMLVANGVLPPRDDALVQLEAWVAARLDEVITPEHRSVLRSYATWRVLRRTRERAASSNRPTTPTAHAKQCLVAAIALCGFLDAQGVTLSECSQGDVDRWFDQGLPSADRVGDFLDWFKQRRLTADLVVVPSLPRVGAAMDEDTRWALVHRLLHDDAPRNRRPCRRLPRPALRPTGLPDCEPYPRPGAHLRRTRPAQGWRRKHRHSCLQTVRARSSFEPLRGRSPCGRLFTRKPTGSHRRQALIELPGKDL